MTHLSPVSAEARVDEVKKILSFIDHTKENRYLLMGDLNSLSEKDIESYKKQNLINTFEKEVHLKNKFVHGHSLDFRAMNELYKEFMDLGFLYDHLKHHILNKHYDDPDHFDFYNISYSVPTAFQPDFSNHFFSYFHFVLFTFLSTFSERILHENRLHSWNEECCSLCERMQCNKSS